MTLLREGVGDAVESAALVSPMSPVTTLSLPPELQRKCPPCQKKPPVSLMLPSPPLVLPEAHQEDPPHGKQITGEEAADAAAVAAAV